MEATLIERIEHTFKTFFLVQKLEPINRKINDVMVNIQKIANKMQLRETTQQKPMSTVLNDQIHNDRRANKSEAFKVVIVVTYQSRHMGNL